MEPTKTCAYMYISKPTYIPIHIYKNIGYLHITGSNLITPGRLLFQETYTPKIKTNQEVGSPYFPGRYPPCKDKTSKFIYR